MRAMYFVGILTYFLIMVSTASAATFHLTETNDDYYYGVPIDVQVDYEGRYITVTVIEPAENQVVNGYTIKNVDLKEIWIWNPDNPIVTDGVTDESVAGTTWEVKSGVYKVANFGKFTSKITQPTESDKTIGPIKINLENNVGIPINDKGYGIAVHVSFDLENETQTVDCSGKVVGNIPEFPSIVLPIAAIMGILLISQNRKKER